MSDNKHIGNTIFNEVVRQHKDLVSRYYSPIKLLLTNEYTLNCMREEGVVTMTNTLAYEAFGLPLKVNSDLTPKIYIKVVLDE